MNAEMLEGMVDGSYKRVIRDRSNYPDPDRRVQRADKLDLAYGYGGYGVVESPQKRTPDGRFTHDEGRVPSGAGEVV